MVNKHYFLKILRPDFLTSNRTPLETCRNILTLVINFTKDFLYFICYYLSDCQDRIVIRYRLAMSPYVFPNIKSLKLTITICNSFWHHNDSSHLSLVFHSFWCIWQEKCWTERISTVCHSIWEYMYRHKRLTQFITGKLRKEITMTKELALDQLYVYRFAPF